MGFTLNQFAGEVARSAGGTAVRPTGELPAKMLFLSFVMKLVLSVPSAMCWFDSLEMDTGYVSVLLLCDRDISNFIIFC